MKLLIELKLICQMRKNEKFTKGWNKYQLCISWKAPGIVLDATQQKATYSAAVLNQQRTVLPDSGREWRTTCTIRQRFQF